MSRLTWDATGERTYETGVDQCVLYKQNSSGAYPEGVAWNGITSIEEAPEGAEVSDIYADNMKYLSLVSAETFKCTIGAYTYPEDFATCDGTAAPVAGVLLGQQNRASFGLCYRTTLGNDVNGNSYGYKLHLIYGCKASPSSRSYQTINDSPEAIEFSWEVNTTPVPVSGGYKAVANLTIDSTKVDATKLGLLLDKLYGKDASGGSEGSTAYLPLPDEVIDTLD